MDFSGSCSESAHDCDGTDCIPRCKNNPDTGTGQYFKEAVTFGSRNAQFPARYKA